MKGLVGTAVPGPAEFSVPGIRWEKSGPSFRSRVFDGNKEGTARDSGPGNGHRSEQYIVSKEGATCDIRPESTLDRAEGDHATRWWPYSQRWRYRLPQRMPGA